ncbi:peptidylprolyl isomerase [Chryseobacterium taklimakanense]|uniref:Foldase protein prsA n=1 Tax=Chryseobacterium taklimakanense TaxID=536441 RepID=A0A239XWE2_9FLAO|nr:peptidylprolyl isomerase [Chryseobacterium taklimakanense]SNV50732.1 Foldase protein prsA precursor [Chryseobacterium taklimakanense]
MVKNLKLLSLFMAVFTLFTVKVNAQLQKGSLVDGITAVIGNEIVLESDIEEQMNYARQQGANVTDRCEFLENIINNKLLIYEAKRDTLIANQSAMIKERADQKYNQILRNFPDERTMLNAYKFRSAYEMKNAIEKIDTDQYYGQQKYARITEKVDVTPNEVTDFYNTYKHQLPMVKDEVSVSQIMMFPKLTEAHKNELKAKLLKIKQDIQNGETFEQMARIYSEDTSASNGGLFTNVAKGTMVKPFEAAALNLQEGEISDPVETEFGYHLIQLVKKTGKVYDVRHILLKSTPNEEEIAAAREELNNIRTQIEQKKITFKEAAYKYSDDKQTKFNGGVLSSQDGSSKIEKINLSPTLAYQIAGLNPGDITDVFSDQNEREQKTVNIVMVNEVIPSHQLDIATDYERIKNLALERKKGETVERWIKSRLPDVFISINERYNNCAFKSSWDKK